MDSHYAERDSKIQPRVEERPRDDIELQDSSQTTREPLKDRLWLWELFAWLICALGLAAIAIILAVTEGEPIPTWTARASPQGRSFTVTVNSVISLFSTLVKSTLLIPVVASLHQLKWIWFKEERPLTHVTVFEGAGKGPLGSVMLIWTLRGRALACLGAFIVIASLGIDFTLQQLVTYPFRATPIGNGTIARSNIYSAFQQEVEGGNPVVEMPLRAALYRGVYNFGESQFLPSPDCTSGNCTWTQPYLSIGVCSRCTEVTNLINKTCSAYPFEEEEFAADGTVLRKVQIGDPIPYCSHNLAGGQGLNETVRFPMIMQLNGTYATTYFKDLLKAHIASFTIMRATPIAHTDFVGEKQRNWWTYDNVNATECGFDLCVKKYEGIMDKNIFTEKVVDTYIDEDSFDDFNVFSRSEDVVIQVPSAWSDRSDDHDANKFIVELQTSLAMILMFRGADGPEFWNGAGMQFEGTSPFFETEIARFISPLSNTGLSELVDSVAASMTKRMREATSNHSVGLGPKANGTELQHIPYVSVRWGWIAFPAVLVFLSLIFLVSTIFQNSKEDTMLWKANTLANFYHPLTKDGRDELQMGHNALEAEQIAEKMKVKWSRTAAGVRLIQKHEA